MMSATARFGSAALVFMSVVSGALINTHDAAARAQCTDCENGQCAQGCGRPDCEYCNGNGEEIDRWSEEWYQMRADSPVGTRQVYKKGKLWPPYPRPTGEKQTFWHKYHANHYWPWPYVCQDRAYVRNLSDMQIANGWIANNTLYEYHFDPETNELNHAGKLHLQRILEDSPYQHRTVWVQKPISAEAANVRVELVRLESITLVGEADIAPICLRKATPSGRPAEEINRIREAELNTMPQPRILYTPVPTGTGGGT